MEEIKMENELKLCEVKRDNLGKQLEKVQSQASDLLIFSLHWKDLEEYLKAAEDKVANRFRELALKEKELKDKSFALEERAKLVHAAEAQVADLEKKSDGFRLEIEEKRKQVDVLLAESNAEELRLTQLRKSVEECSALQSSKISELNEVMEQFDRTQSLRKELDCETERKKKDLTLVQNKTEECEKLLETRSSELIKTQGEVELNREQLRQMKIDLDQSQSRNRELDKEIERKRKDLEVVLDKIAECVKGRELVEKQLDSKQKLLETRSLELVSKEKEHNEMKETIRKIALKIESEGKTLERAKVFNQQLSEKQLGSTRRDLDKCIAEYDCRRKELRSVKDRFRECVQNLEIKEKELKSLDRQVEEGEKKMQHLDHSVEELTRQLKLKQEEVCGINKTIKECSGELEAKRKHRDQVQSSITNLAAELKSKESDLDSVNKKIQDSLKDRDQVQSSITNLTTELKSKECDLNSVKKKIQDSLEDLQSKEEKKVRLRESLMGREQELSWKEKELGARKEKIELKEKELDAREDRLDKKDELLKSTELKLVDCAKDCELKAKKLSSFIQQSNTDHDLVRDATNVSDNKTLQLLLHGVLKKCPQLHLDLSRSLEASSDPAKLVLDTIQELYSAHQRTTTVTTNLDPNSFRRSSIYLLECLMDMSLKPMGEVQEEAVKFSTEWKNTTPVNAENPVEVVGFLHFLVAFSLAYSFDDDQVQNLFDVAFLSKYAPSLYKALGVSALAPVNNVLSLDVKPLEVNIASSQLGSEDALGDYECSASFAPNEVSMALPTLDDPGRFVLSSVDKALEGAHQRGELCLAEPIVKTLVPLLEELPRVVCSTNPDLQSDAARVATRWSKMMANTAQKSQLEAWAFLQFIVAFGLVKKTKKDETLQFASHVAHFKDAPKLFHSLGLSSAIPNFVEELLKKALYIPAIRFMFYFNVKNKFSPLGFLKEEINNLRRSAKDKRRFEFEPEDRDAGKMRDIIELIEDLNLEIDLPGDLVVKFMVPREIQNQSQCVVVSSPSVPVQSPQVLHMQASHTVIHSSYIATNGSNPSLPQIRDVETYQAAASTEFQGQSLYHAGFKRPRMDSQTVIRPCFSPPSGYDRFLS